MSFYNVAVAYNYKEKETYILHMYTCICIVNFINLFLILSFNRFATFSKCLFSVSFVKMWQVFIVNASLFNNVYI